VCVRARLRARARVAYVAFGARTHARFSRWLSHVAGETLVAGHDVNFYVIAKQVLETYGDGMPLSLVLQEIDVKHFHASLRGVITPEFLQKWTDKRRQDTVKRELAKLAVFSCCLPVAFVAICSNRLLFRLSAP
jgi:hypothetical protein